MFPQPFVEIVATFARRQLTGHKSQCSIGMHFNDRVHHANPLPGTVETFDVSLLEMHRSPPTRFDGTNFLGFNC